MGNTNFPDGVNAGSLSIADVAVTATAAELNALATTGLSAAELAVLDGVTAGTVLAGKAVVTTTSKHIDALVISDGGLALGAGAGTAITSSAAELNLLDGSVAGTAVASKALVLGATKNADTIVITNIDAGASGTAGTVDVFPATAAKGKLAVSVTDQTGDTTVDLVVGAMAAARTITLRDPGAAASVLTSTDGTAAATTATAVELTRAADVSTRLVAAGGTLAATEAAHEGRIIALDTLTGSVVTLPAATGSGGRYRFITTVLATSNSHVIKVANASDTMIGQVLVMPDDAATGPVIYFRAGGTDDTITLNRSTTGSTALSDHFELIDIAANKWFVAGVTSATGTEATPFSATVA